MATCTQHSTATRDTLQNLHQRVSEERSHAGGTPLTKEPQCHRNNLKPQSCLSCRARLIHTSRFSSVQSQRPGLTGMMEFLVVFSNLNVSKASCRGGKGKKKKRSGVVTSAFLDQTYTKDRRDDGDLHPHLSPENPKTHLMQTDFTWFTLSKLKPLILVRSPLIYSKIHREDNQVSIQLQVINNRAVPDLILSLSVIN